MAGIQRAAGSSSGGGCTGPRRSLFLAGQQAVEAARNSVSGNDQHSVHLQEHGSLGGMDADVGMHETDPLLGTQVQGGDGGEDDIDAASAIPRRCARASVFPLLQRVRDDVRSTIDTHLEWHELTALDINYAVVRPLVIKWSNVGKESSNAGGGNGTNHDRLSILFVFLVNRLQFQREAERDLALQGINTTRASLCELLAMKLLRSFAHDPLELITALTFPFSPFQGASNEVLESEGLLEGKKGRARQAVSSPNASHFAHPQTNDDDDVQNERCTEEPIFGPGQCSSALELAINSRAKKFIKTPLCQRCVSGIYEGRIVLSYQSAHAIVDDSYKKRPLGIYDPAKAPFLDHHRLRVPLIRSRIEFFNFCVLLLLYVWCLAQKRSEYWTTAESVYIVWVASFALDEVAQMQEHGIVMYAGSLYNILDFLFCIVSFVWFGMRVAGVTQHDAPQSSLSFDTLSLGAILLCPRVASALVQDNVILLALKAMLAEFTFFMVLAMVCFSGFLYTFWSLSGPQWTAGRIIWLMTKVWLGNSYILFDTAVEFSPIFGPVLMVFFAVMANTLLLTILISLLSNTFSMVAQNAVEEAMYQFACKTVSGISSEALLSYQMMPLNLVALVVLGPASLVLSPRYLHKANVYLLRATSWPLLLVIRFGAYYWPGALRQQQRGSGTGNMATEADTETLGRGSVTSYLLSMSAGDRTSHFLSWLPLPRTRVTPDRDIIEAAFMRAKMECPCAGNRGHAPERPTYDDVARGLTAGLTDEHSSRQGMGYGVERQVQTAPPEMPQHASSSRPAPSSEEAHAASARGGTFAPANDRTAFESPLAKLFGSALARGSRAARGMSDQTPPRNARPSPQPASEPGSAAATGSARQVEPSEGGTGSGRAGSDATPRGERSEIRLDADAVHAGEALPGTSENEQDDARFEAGDHGVEEHASTHALVRSLTRQLDAYEQRQQRIEELLARLVGGGAG